MQAALEHKDIKSVYRPLWMKEGQGGRDTPSSLASQRKDNCRSGQDQQHGKIYIPVITGFLLSNAVRKVMEVP